MKSRIIEFALSVGLWGFWGLAVADAQTEEPRPRGNPNVDRPTPRPPTPVPVPPTPSANATGSFALIWFRGALEKVGNNAIQMYNTSGREGSLSWNGATPLHCGRACVNAPLVPYPYAPVDIVYAWLNFHWCCWGAWPFEVAKDFSFQARMGAKCEGWQTGQGRLKLEAEVDRDVYPAGGNWLADLIDFFDRNYTTDRMLKELNQQLPGFGANSTTMDLGTCRSLGVWVDRDPSGRNDAFVWDP